MKVDLRDRFYVEMLLCMATSSVKFTEHNELTQAARKLVSFEFPEDLNPTLDDICFLIEGFYSIAGDYNHKAANTFIKAFARKDPEKFQILARDQSKSLHYRKHRMKKGIDSLIISIATLYGVDYSSETINLKLY